jgi:hypothetical protein
MDFPGLAMTARENRIKLEKRKIDEFRFDFTHKEMDEINNYLEKYMLFGFQQRVVLRF